MIKIPQISKKQRILIDVDKFDKGVNTLIDDARLDRAMAKEARNLIQTQDGRWSPRWGSAYYGVAVTGESSLDGGYMAIKDDGTRVIITIGGTTGKIWASEDDAATWTEISGATMTTGFTPTWTQIKNYLYISNGEDNLIRLDLTATPITASQYSALDAPAWGGTPLARGAGLATGNYTMYYQVTALNEVGETVGSTEESITVDIHRDDWDEADEYIDLDWTAVSSATRYQIYWSDESGDEVLIGSTTDTAFSDDGSNEANSYIEVPLSNTTSAPKLKQMAISGNRIWGVAEDGAVWFSGTGQYTTAFSPFYGGGYIYLEKGGIQTPVAVKNFLSSNGSSMALVICSDPSGQGSVWQVDIEFQTVGNISIAVPVATKIITDIGANSPQGVCVGENDIFMANKMGIYALKHKPQWSVLDSDEMTINIRPSYRSLQGDLVQYTSSIFFEGKFFFSVSSSSRNDRTIVYDVERDDAGFTWYWSIGAKQFFVYTDTDDEVHLLTIPVSGGRLIEWNERFANDLGIVFDTSYISPLIQIAKDKQAFARIKEVIFEIGRPYGTINLEVYGVERKKGYSTIASATLQDRVSNTGFSTFLFSTNAFSDSDNAPETYDQASVKKRIKVRSLLNSIQFRISSSINNIQYDILSIQAKGAITTVKAPSSWN